MQKMTKFALISVVSLCCLPWFGYTKEKPPIYNFGVAFGTATYNSGLDFDYLENSTSNIELFGELKLDDYSIYADLGSLGSYEFTSGGRSGETSINAATISTGKNFNLINKLDFYTKIGYGILALDQTAHSYRNFTESQSIGSTLVAGTGFTYTPAFLDKIMFRLDYQYYYFKADSAASNNNNASNNISSLTLGIGVQF